MHDATLVGIHHVKFPVSDLARSIAGFDPVSFAVADHDAAQAWADRLDRLGVPHSPVMDATIGWILVFHDPDGTEIHLYSMERHGIDPTGRPHTGQPVKVDPAPHPSAGSL